MSDQINWQQIIQDPSAFLQNVSIEQLQYVLKTAQDLYTEGNPVISDAIFDLLKDAFDEMGGNLDIGAEVKYNKVKLPIWMGSMDKMKPGKEKLQSWSRNHPGPYLISDKLDGISLLLNYQNGKLIQCLTRGNGEIGSDVSWLIKYLDVPKKLKINGPLKDGNCYVRGELIFSKKNWEQVSKIKDRKGNPIYKASRNAVAGILSTKPTELNKLPKGVISKLSFVSFRLDWYNLAPIGIRDAFMRLEAANFPLAFYIITAGLLKSDYLSQILEKRRQQSPFVIDGIIVHDDSQAYVPNDSGNPKYAFAWKTIATGNGFETTVTSVNYQISKDGKLKPVIQFIPFELDGVTIQKASGFNAKYVKNNKIDVGAKVFIIRSGDVIPKIEKVIEPSQSWAQPSGNWYWSGVDAVSSDESSSQTIAKYTYFTNTLKIDGWRQKTIEKIVNGVSGLQPLNWMNFIQIQPQQIQNLQGFSSKRAQKLVYDLQKQIQSAEDWLLISALNIHEGLAGSKRIKLILKQLPQYLDPSINNIPIQSYMAISSIGQQVAQVFYEKRNETIQLLSQIRKIYPFDNGVKQIQEQGGEQGGKSGVVEKVDGLQIAFSGFRDQVLQQQLENSNATITSTISKKTNLLVVSDINKKTSKITKASELNIPVLQRNTFIQWLNSDVQQLPRSEI